MEGSVLAALASAGTLLSAIAAATSAYFSAQSAKASEKALHQSRSVFQEQLLQILIDKWNSPQICRVRALSCQNRLTDLESAKISLRQILDFFDMVCGRIKREVLPPELVDEQLGYWMWAYYQIWQQDIAEMERTLDIHWDDFMEFVDWMKNQRRGRPVN